MELTDWRGNIYKAGDTIVYPRMSGRSVEMSEGVVEEIYEVWQDLDNYSHKWQRVDDSTPAEAKRVTRVRVKPTGLGSWSNYYSSRATDFDQVDIKPVTILNIENITVVPKK